MEPGVEEVAVQHGILSMILGSGLVVQLVLLLLIFLSVWSWAIAIAKYLQYRKAAADTEAFSSVMWETRNLGRVDDATRRFSGSPLSALFSAAYRELTHALQEGIIGGRYTNEEFSTVKAALERSEIDEAHKLEKGLTFLATTASAAPFIGLFGTVWGIMNAFQGLGVTKASTLQAVAPGISEALVATAVGLAAAIPAAIAFNFFSSSARSFREKMSAFHSQFIELAKTQLQKRAG